MTDEETVERFHLTLFIPTGNNKVETSERYVTDRAAWMEKQIDIQPYGTRLTWHKGDGMGTHQYYLDQTGWALKRVTYGRTTR